MATVDLRIVAFREGDMWVAHCLEHDIVAQAEDLSSLKRRIEVAIKIELQESLRRQGEPFKGIGPAPEYIREKWAHGHAEFRSHGSTMVENGRGAAVDYEMALCA